MISWLSAARWLRRSGLALATILSIAERADGQTFCDLPNGNNKSCLTPAMSITMQVPSATKLTLASAMVFPNNDVKAADYTAGFKAAGTVTLNAWSNTAATVSVTSSAPAPYSGMIWSTDGTTFSSPSSLFAMSGPTANLQKVITFRTKLLWASDAPGSYTETLTFTISAP
jgi:hypothetical protein